ncbi:MAG: diacylglycerol kinase family protein [Candidatus Omnitrophota bacterium]
MPKKIIRDIFRFEGYRKSFRNAARGIIYLFLYHRNMRLVFIIGFATLMIGLYIGFKGIEIVALGVTITLVFMAEIFNTAVELMMDAIAEKYNTKIRLVKDIAAGIVVISCLNAFAVGFILFGKKLGWY